MKLESSKALGFMRRVNSQVEYLQRSSQARSRSFIEYTADDESAAFSGIDNAQGGTVYAQLDDLNAIRAALENLRLITENAISVQNALLDDLREKGLVA